MAIPDRSTFANGKFVNIEDNDSTTGTSVSDISANAKFVNIEDIDVTTSKTNVATDGGIVVDGDVSGSAANSGVVQGVLAGDDVDANGLTVGDGNTQADDVDAGAFALGGDATNADVDVDGDVNGNLNLGIGEDIGQLAEQDNSVEESFEFESSFNTDNSETVESLVDIEDSQADVDLDARSATPGPAADQRPPTKDSRGARTEHAQQSKAGGEEHP